MEGRRRPLDTGVSPSSSASNLQSGGQIRGVATVPSAEVPRSRHGRTRKDRDGQRTTPSYCNNHCEENPTARTGTLAPPNPDPGSRKRKLAQLTDAELGSPETSSEREPSRQLSQNDDARRRIDGFSGDNRSYIQYLMEQIGERGIITSLETAVASQRKKRDPFTVEQLVQGITSSDAILQFQNLVTSSRTSGAPLREALPHKDEERLMALTTLYRSHNARGAISRFYRTIIRMELVKHLLI